MAELKQKTAELFSSILSFIKNHRIMTSIVSAVLAVSVLSSVVIITQTNKNNQKNQTSSGIDSVISSEEILSSEPEVESVISSKEESVVSNEEVSSKEESSKPVSTTSKKPTVSKKPATVVSKKPTSSKVTSTVSKKPSSTGSYKYNSNVDINDNVFLDAMVYTGYNLKKHIADGNMWKYILASQKRGMGYLSNITYAGGSTGYETRNGKPDIKAFERKGLVCASYVTYVYFNYLPNVAGIDTSSLTRPNKSYSANDWYIAAKNWVKKGYSTTISFTASKSSSGYINFKPSKSIPIGSIMVFCDAKNRSDYCSHVAIYAGYKNGYNWVYHVGNENGPEFCAVERMYFGPDPQWPIRVITTPSNIRMQAAVEISLKDDSSKPISGVSFTLKNLSTGKKISLGKTNLKGIIVKENLPYGKYQLTETVKSGYTSKKTSWNIELTTANNSYKKIKLTNTKIKVVESSAPSTASSSLVESSTQTDSSQTESTNTEISNVS